MAKRKTKPIVAVVGRPNVGMCVANIVRAVEPKMGHK